jgi:hypothetical protein
MSEDNDRRERHAELIEAVEIAVSRQAEREKAEQAKDRERQKIKDALTSKVSITAIALTLLMSFLSFARSERNNASGSLKGRAAKAKADADANWILYQTRNTERAGYVLAEDNLRREVAKLPDGDPRLPVAEQEHVEYAGRVATLDNENRGVFFEIEELQNDQIQSARTAKHLDRKVDRYDMGTRVLTLALVLLSVTLLAKREFLYWMAILTAFGGAAICLSGYFLW